MDKGNKKNLLQSLGIYSISFAVITGVILGIFAVRGDTFIKVVDGGAQHFPVLCYIRTYLLQIFHSGSFSLPMVDFSVGQGFDIIGTLNYYGFGDPLTLLTVLFPENALEAMYTFFIFLRIYLAGIGFMLLCRTLGQKGKAAAASGALLYAFCSFSFLGGFKHPCFLNGVMYLPFLLLGIERIIKKKGMLPLTVTVACSFMSNYYFMYMNTVLAGIYLLIRLLGHYRELGIKGFLQVVGKIILGYLWGTGIAGFILFPAVYAFLNNGRETSGQGMRLFYSPGYYSSVWRSMADTMSGGSWTCPGTGAVGIISLAVLVVKHPKKEKKLLLGTAVLLLMLSIPAVGSMMNGFSYVTNRWSYGFALLLALAAVRMVPYLREFTAKQRTAVTVLMLIFCVPFAWARFVDGAEGSMNSAVVLLISLLLLFVTGWLQQRKPHRLLACAVVGITALGILWNAAGVYQGGERDGGKGFKKVGDAVEKLNSSPLETESLIEDPSFYRIENHWDIFNYSLWKGLNTTNFYYSVVPSTMSDLYTSVWLNAQERAYVLDSLDSRTALTAIASVKYFTNDQERSVPFGYEKKGETEGKGNTTNFLYENKNALPLGYTYDTVMSRRDYDRLGPLEREQSLLDHAVVEKLPEGFSKSSGNPKNKVVTKEVKILKAKKAKLQNGKLKVKKGGSITFGFEGDPDSETYLVLEGIRSKDGKHDGRMVNISSSEADTRMKVGGRKYVAYLKKEGEVLNLGYSKDAQTECTMSFQTKRTFYLDEITVQCVSMKDMEERLQKLKNESLQNISVEENRITGTVHVSKPKIMQFSIPYSKGWKVFVDGKKVRTFPSGIAYTGISLEEGSHAIRLQYTSPWIVPGAVTTAAGLCAIAVYLFLFKRKLSFRRAGREGIRQ